MRTPASFDTWTVLILFAAIQGLVFSIFLFFTGDTKGRKQKLDLSLLISLFCLMITEYVLWWTGYLIHVPHAMNFSGVFNFVFGPLLFFYFRSIFRNYGFHWRKDWPHFIFALVYLLGHLSFYSLPEETKVKYMTEVLKAPSGIPWPWLNLIQSSLYIVICYYEYRNEAENTQEVKKWFKLVLTLFSGYTLSVISYYILVRMPWFDATWDYFISAMMMIFIYAVAAYGYFHDKVFNGFDLISNPHKPKYQNSGLSFQFGAQMLLRLNMLMDSEKMYVDDDISLDKLASVLGISRHQLSQVLNEQAGMNFFEYINSRRIEEAKHLLANSSKKELNIIEIAYRVGYTNKVTFNNTFRKYTGMTPSEFRSSAETTRIVKMGIVERTAEQNQDKG